MESSDLIFERNGDNITAAGYLIDSKLMQSNNPVARVTTGGGIELAVPLGLFYIQDLAKKSSNSFNTSVFDMYYEEDDETTVSLVDETLYDKLLSMVNTNVASKAKTTRRKRQIARKTRKH